LLLLPEVFAENATVKRQMLANLKQIISAAEQYALDNRGFPATGSDLRELLVGPKNYIVNDSGFRNPLTGESSFRFTYTGGPVKLNDPNGPAIEMGRLSGQGGAYIWTNKGISWQPDGGSPMPL
jgi:type II secretory pathway pseudopilin PulG